MVIALNTYVLVMVSREVWDLAPRSGAHDSTTIEVINKAKQIQAEYGVWQHLGSHLSDRAPVARCPVVAGVPLPFAVLNALLGGRWIFLFHLL